MSLVGPGGLLSQLTKNVLETALEAELTEHLGHEHDGTPIVENMRKRDPHEDGTDGDRPGRDRGSQGS